jgi:hypothetical protein
MSDTISAKPRCLGYLHVAVVQLVNKMWAAKISQSMSGHAPLEDPDHPWQILGIAPTEADARELTENLVRIWANLIHVDCQIHD